MPTNVEKRDYKSKRLALWDYTNTQNPAIAPKINQIKFTGTPMSGVINWNTWVPPELDSSVPFEPWVQGPANMQGNDYTYLTQYLAGHPGAIVHFYNEPELRGVSVDQAVTDWSTFSTLGHEYGAKLVSPATAGNENGKAWLSQFLGNITEKGYPQPDFVGAHYYGNDPTAAQAYLQDIATSFGKPIIVSEIANIAATQQEGNRFTAAMANWLDDQDWVHEYAFFGAMNHLPNDGGWVKPASMLMNADGSFKDIMYKLIWDEPIKLSS
jgi:hypothetical protein